MDPHNLIPPKVVRKACYKHGLRPRIWYRNTTHPYSHPDFRDKTFFSIDFYWDEYYYERKVMDEPKEDALVRELNSIITEIGGYYKHEWGNSDGHLMVYITLNKQ